MPLDWYVCRYKKEVVSREKRIHAKRRVQDDLHIRKLDEDGLRVQGRRNASTRQCCYVITVVQGHGERNTQWLLCGECHEQVRKNVSSRSTSRVALGPIDQYTAHRRACQCYRVERVDFLAAAICVIKYRLLRKS